MNYKEKYKKFFRYTADEYVPCLVCNAPAVDIHHIIFRSKGGTDDMENLASLCRHCHDTVHFKNFGEFISVSDLQRLQKQKIEQKNLKKNTR